MLNVNIKNQLKKILVFGVFAFPLHVLAADTVGNSIDGAKAWANHCARCHNMREPSEFRDDEWRPIVIHMRVRAGLSGQQARDILAFLQSSNYVAAVKSDSLSKAASGASADGKAIYNQTCIACHGADGKGAISGVPSLAERISKSDAVLLNNILNGYQSPGAPMAMPARGGNPNLSDQDIREVLSYIRKTYGQ